MAVSERCQYFPLWFQYSQASDWPPTVMAPGMKRSGSG